MRSITLLSLLLLSCSNHQPALNPDADSSALLNDGGQREAKPSSPAFPYSLARPLKKFVMPDHLREISAIDVYKKSKLVCVQDEDGKVFVYDLKKSEVKDVVDFGPKGDYEGIANVHDTIYVLSSHGHLYQVTGFNTKDQRTTEFKTPLDESNDTEGLCYDSIHHRLLVACKKFPGMQETGLRAVYAFDLSTMSMADHPAISIQLDVLKAFLLQNDKSRLLSEEAKNLFDPQKGDVTFQPSEIAIHPLTGDLYVLSSVGKLLVVLDTAGSIRYIQELNPDSFKQPEGLCFHRDGTLYISNEGRNGHADILEFNYQPDAN